MPKPPTETGYLDPKDVSTRYGVTVATLLLYALRLVQRGRR